MSISQENFLFFLTLFILLILFYTYIQKRIKLAGLSSSVDGLYSAYGLDFIYHQQEDIYNISSRVQPDNYQWPTHNARLSIDHLTILNQANKPIYDDAPPSYDEVMKTAVPSNGESSTVPEVVVEAPKPTTAAGSTRPM